MRLLCRIFMVLLLFASCRKVYISDQNGWNQEPIYFSVNINRTVHDPSDTTKRITDYLLNYAWNWDEMKVDHTGGMYTVRGFKDSIQVVTMRWKADTLFDYASLYVSNDLGRWPTAIEGEFTVFDLYHKDTIPLHQSYCIKGDWYTIPSSPDTLTEIVFTAFIDSGRYAHSKLVADIHGPAKTFK